MILSNLKAIAASLAVLAGTAFQASVADEPKVTVEYDINYARPNGTELKLDIARPGEGDGPFPAVFVIHGGGWSAGDKKDMRPALSDFARRGYVAISPQYRFSPKDTFPAQVHDVKAAVRWVKSHAKEYKVDTKHIGAVGFSAGGHLAMMLGLTGPSDGLEGDAVAGEPDTSIQAVVNYFGPTDLAATDYPEVTQPIINRFLGGTPKEKAKEACQASPLTFVSKGDAPILTFQGTKDPLVPHSQATKLADALSNAGVPGRVELLIGAGHGWGGDDMKRTLADMFAFFDHYLKPQPQK